jgi:hypothetical protein
MASEAEFRQGAVRILEYLGSEYSDEGSSRTGPGNIQFYYKIPAVLNVGGNRAQASRVLQQAEQRFFPDRDFLIDDDPYASPWKAYLAGWLAWGAGSLGRFDLARRIMESVHNLHTGAQGAYVHETGSGPVQDTQRSSAAAMGEVWAMNLDRGLRVAEFLRYALDQQPRPDDAFYAYFDLRGAAVREDSDRNVCFDLSDAGARPALFGTTVAALAWLARASGEDWVAQLAHRYLRLVLSHRHDPAEMPLATKLGWAAMLSNVQVADPDAQAFSRRLGLQLLERQKPDGSINFDDVPEVPKPVDKVWMIGWTCDAALTLIALADGSA